MKRLFKIVGLLFCLLSSALAKGQDTGQLRMNKDLPPENDVSLWGGVEEGRFKPTQAALFQWSAGADASVARYGIHTTWTGAISLGQTMGKHTGSSSLFLDPEYFPMDLVDLASGMTSRQTGRVEIGLLSDLSDLWAAGFKASIKAANETKKGTLHPATFGLDAQFEPTITFVFDDDACIVSSYLVRLRTERVKMGQPGEGVSPVFLDEGMRYGVYEPGLDLFPVMEISHGFYERYLSPEISGGLGITWKRGRAGSPDYSRFKYPGSILKGFFEANLEGFEIDQIYRVAYQRDRDQLREASEGGYATRSDRVTRNALFGFALRPHEGTLKRAGIDLEGNIWYHRGFLSAQDKTRMLGGMATAYASLAFGRVDLDVRVSGGGGRWQERGNTYGPNDESVRLAEDWARNMDYRMLPRVGGGGTVTYRAAFLEGLSFQLCGDLVHAFKMVHLGGKNRETATLRVGYHF